MCVIFLSIIHGEREPNDDAYIDTWTLEALVYVHHKWLLALSVQVSLVLKSIIRNILLGNYDHHLDLMGDL